MSFAAIDVYIVYRMDSGKDSASLNFDTIPLMNLSTFYSVLVVVCHAKYSLAAYVNM